MSDIGSFRSIIDLWPTRSALSSELGQSSSESVRKWWQRDRIPPEWWSALLGLPRTREAGITAELLTDLAARRDRLEVA